jgi:CheY-like chemotaxis protein
MQTPCAVLLVDDNPLILRANARALRDRGWAVFTTEDPPVAPEAYSAVDVVLTDWHCGRDGHGGEQVARDCLIAGVPCVVYTGADLEGPHVVRKPARLDDIERALLRAIEERAATIPHAAPDRLYRQLVLSTWRNRWLAAARRYDGGSR